MTKRKFLITGASGFIGANLARRLIKDGQEVHLILRDGFKTWRLDELLKKFQIHYQDLSDKDQLIRIFKTVRPDVIYHLATSGAYSYQSDPDLIIKTNVLGTWHLLQAAMTVGFELFVNTGSSSEYGFKTQPMQETDLLEPNSYYAVTKSFQTYLSSFIANSQNKNIVTLRPFSVYGRFEEPTRLIPTLMKALFFKKPLNLVNPKTSRDQIYIDDIVEAYLKIDQLKQNRGQYFNIGTGIQSTIKEVVEKAVLVTGENTTFNWGKMKGRSWDSNTWVADISKAKKLLDFNPKISLEQGLKLMWIWFLKNYQYY